MIFSGFILVLFLISLSILDIKQGVLPDVLTLSLLWLGLLLNSLLPWVSLKDAVLGAASAYLFLWVIFWLFLLIYQKEGMGYGDFKFFSALGAWFGWQCLPFILMVASLGTLAFIFLLYLTGRHYSKAEIPFGPGLAFGAGCALWKSLLTFI